MHAFGLCLGREGRDEVDGVRSSLLIGTPRYIFFSLHGAAAEYALAVRRRDEGGGGLFRHPQYLNNGDCGKKSDV